MKKKFTEQEEYWMALALREAAKGKGKTSPNPMVGAVVVRGGRMLASGHHPKAGLPHAEIEALKKIKNPKGATLFVTLEPCCHKEKRTPPCVDAIVKAGIARVVIGCRDPNPQVAGRGIRFLRRHGVEVRQGVLQSECHALNKYYNHWIRHKTPWVLLKAAVSLDGKVALAGGRSKWITGKQARAEVHRIRAEVDGILVGAGTVLADNPRLTARAGKNAPQPVRVILDPRLRVPETSRVFSRRSKAPCWVITGRGVAKGKRQRLEQKGAVILTCPLRRSGEFDLKKLMQLLGEKGLMSLLVEGGPTVWTHFLKQRQFHEILLFLSPRVLGADAIPLTGPLGLKTLAVPLALQTGSVEFLGEDLLLRVRSRLR